MRAIAAASKRRTQDYMRGYEAALEQKETFDGTADGNARAWLVHYLAAPPSMPTELAALAARL